MRIPFSSRTSPASRSSHSRGAALVIILAFIVLLTVLVVAYFSYSSLQSQISQASVNQAAVDIFAQGAISSIVGDLKQEIADGSTNFTYGTNQLYLPYTATNVVPTRVGTDNSLPNLVKRSASGLAFYTGGISRAAAVSSTNASQNSRSISAARWNASLFLPKAQPASSTDLTPTNTFTPPDWILVARNGSNPTAWNDNLRWNPTNSTTAVGRYAYAIYDEGGVLDVNVAGYPPGSSTNFTADKGGLAYADLTVLPEMTTNVISALVGWRNYATSQPGGSFPSYTFVDSAKTNYFNFVRNNTSGLQRTANTNLASGQSDRQFLSRRQLIQFLTQVVPSNATEKAALQEALQYLGTFSRDLEQPSFMPDPNRPKNTTHDWATSAASTKSFGGNNAYDPSGNLQDTINPILLKVRDANNDPVMKRRFPLSRLSLIKTNPSADEQAKIMDYFGLKWSSDHWVYDHGNPNQIYKLSEIPNGREPDFFETLKAVIHCDSLGKQYGGTEGSVGAAYSPHLYDSGAAAIDGVINYQIIQIGANLIDQSDTNSYPTHISYAAREFYGVENLPYLAGWRISWYRMKHLTAADIDSGKQPPLPPKNDPTDPTPDPVFPYETWVMLQPIIWNPHAPNTDLVTSEVPTAFRVTAGNVAGNGVGVTLHPLVRPTWWQTGPAYQYPAASGLTSTSWSEATLAPSTSYLSFNAAPNNSLTPSASAFTEPYRLLYHYPAGSNADAAPSYSQGRIDLNTYGSIADPVLASADAVADGRTVVGFFAGKSWTGPYNAPATTFAGANDPQKCLVGGYLSDNLQFVLQYQDASGQWQTYDTINQVYTSSVAPINVSTVDNADTSTNVRGFVTGFRADPRTDRWGLFSMKTFPLAINPSGVAKPASDGIYGTTSIVYNLPPGTTLSPSSGLNSGVIYYLNRNSSGDPLVDWSTASYLSDLSVNLNTGSSTSYIPGKKFYYNDPDHVIRRASGALFSGKDGLPFATANYASRPVVLNRPFRSVTEMGYAFSDTPWKDLNFLMPESGDAALLDAFCVNELDTAPNNLTVAGRINLNTRQPKALQAIIQGASKAEGGTVNAAEALRSAQALVNWTADVTTASGGVLSRGPLRNRSELVGKFVSAVTYSSPTSSNLPNIGYDGSLSYSGFSSMLTSPSIFDSTSDASIKRRRESIIRSLVDCGNARTWNLFIDIIAQTGRYSPSSSSLAQFTVEGETRYWLHLAIDRYTGKVIAKQLEPVSE